MRYAVISDVHGNYPALQAVIRDAEKEGVSHYLFAGDYCISGAWPDECVAAIRAIPDKHVIRGNEEKYLENLIGKDQSGWTDGQMQVSYWCYRNISRENLDHLLELPHKTEFEYGGIKIRMAHSSVDFLGTHPFYTWNSVTVAERNRKPGAVPELILKDMADERDADPAFLEAVSGLEEGIYIFGHSHVQWSYKAKDAEVYLINPGSCGLPLDGIRNSLPYTILDISDSGEVSVEEKRVPFDKENYIRELMQTGQYREANVWSRVIIREAATALEHMYFFLGFAEQYAKDIGDDRRPYALDTWEKAYELWDRQQGEFQYPPRA
ncbi:MAG: metallophosphoesterase family protein [Lachnospiraceae bacterium]|nr:metallophosphoesterase family protein [Lachnospiraceae bacterium]